MKVKTQKLNKSLLKELPYFNLTSCLPSLHGQFNNIFLGNLPSNRDVESLPSLYDLDIFSLNTNLDHVYNPNLKLSSQRLQSGYYSSHSFKQVCSTFAKQHAKSSFTIFHNNIRRIHRNLENLVTHDRVVTSVYRKKTFTGLLTNFFSFTSFSYKTGLIRTLVDLIFTKLATHGLVFIKIFNICVTKN